MLTAVCAVVCLILPVAGVAKTSKTAAKTSASTTTKSTSTKASSKKKSSKSKSRKSSRKRGQKAIDSERVQQIQEALVREHYLGGTPSGKWDDATQSALRRYQGDHGWQNKTVPDSRALISLGLGPNHDHLLNPETAMTTSPAVSKTPAKAVSPDPPPTSATPTDTAPAPQR